jgi:hypothetical protein
VLVVSQSPSLWIFRPAKMENPTKTNPISMITGCIDNNIMDKVALNLDMIIDKYKINIPKELK